MASKINTQQVLKDLQSDWKAADVYHKEWVEKRNKWVDETYGKLYGNEKRNGSRIVSKDIKRQLEWLIPSITEPFISTPDIIKCTPITALDKKAARQNELVLNTQFTRTFDRYNFITRVARVLATEGTCIVQTGWEYQDKKVTREVETVVNDPYTGEQYITTETVEDIQVIVNKPTAHVCRGEDIYVDPTCMGDLDKAQFIIYRYETDLSSLRKDGRYKNLKKVAASVTDVTDPDYSPEDDTSFTFNDVARKKILVYEYWGNYDIDNTGVAKPIVCVWTEHNIVIRLEDNPYPDKKPPFLVVPFTPIPFQLYGEALAENIGDRQKVKTAITRGIIENMARSNNGQIGIREGALSAANEKKFEAGKNFKFRGSPNDFWQGSYNPIPGSVFNVLQLMDNDIESQTGIKSFSGGINGGAISNTATGTRAVMDATSIRRMNLIRNIAENLIKPLMRKWIAYNSEFLDEEEVVRITDEEFITVKRDDLEGRIDVDLSISTTDDNNAKAQQLSFMLQTIGNSMGPELMQLILSEIADLQKMPELSKRIKEYRPQADPVQEQLRQLEIQKVQTEIEKMKAHIEDLQARAGENEIDATLKMAKARLEQAKADKLLSDKDMVDLKFVKENMGVDHTNRLELEELKGRLNLLSMQMQKESGDNQLGVYGG